MTERLPSPRRPNARQCDSTYQTGQRCSDKRDHLCEPWISATLSFGDPNVKCPSVLEEAKVGGVSVGGMGVGVGDVEREGVGISAGVGVDVGERLGGGSEGCVGVEEILLGDIGVGNGIGVAVGCTSSRVMTKIAWPIQRVQRPPKPNRNSQDVWISSTSKATSPRVLLPGNRSPLRDPFVSTNRARGRLKPCSSYSPNIPELEIRVVRMAKFSNVKPMISHRDPSSGLEGAPPSSFPSSHRAESTVI